MILNLMVEGSWGGSMKSKIVLFAAFLALVTLAPTARGQDTGTSQSTPGQSGIPPKLEALRHARVAACSKKAVGDPCSFSGRSGPVQGKCEQTPRKVLVCAAGHPGGATANNGSK